MSETAYKVVKADLSSLFVRSDIGLTYEVGGFYDAVGLAGNGFGDMDIRDPLGIGTPPRSLSIASVHVVADVTP